MCSGTCFSPKKVSLPKAARLRQVAGKLFAASPKLQAWPACGGAFITFLMKCLKSRFHRAEGTNFLPAYRSKEKIGAEPQTAPGADSVHRALSEVMIRGISLTAFGCSASAIFRRKPRRHRHSDFRLQHSALTVCRSAEFFPSLQRKAFRNIAASSMKF